MRGTRALGAIAAIFLAATACSGRAHSSAGRVAPKAVEHAPPPDLTLFVPANQRVTSTQQENLDGGPVPQVVVTTTGAPASGQEFAPADVLLLAWDGFAKRWTSVFDAATQSGFGTVEPDAPMSPSLPADANAPLLPPDQQVENVHVAELRDRPQGSDLLISATTALGDGSGLVVAVVSYQNQVAHVAWSFGAGYSGSATPVGAAPNQRISISTQWETPADPHCCPARSYTFVVARSVDSGGSNYSVVSDDRPWLGAFLLTPTVGGKTRVVSTVTGSPASSLLQPFDILDRVEATPVPSSASLNSPVIDEIAVHHPGDIVQLDIERAGKPMVVRVTLGSRADTKAVRASFPTPGFLGASSEDMTPAVSQRTNLPNVPGAVIVQVQSGSPAEKARLGQNDIITSFDNIAVTSTDLLIVAIATVPPNTSVPVIYVDPSGVQQSANVTLGFPPASTATGAFVMP